MPRLPRSIVSALRAATPMTLGARPRHDGKVWSRHGVLFATARVQLLGVEGARLDDGAYTVRDGRIVKRPGTARSYAWYDEKLDTLDHCRPSEYYERPAVPSRAWAVAAQHFSLAIDPVVAAGVLGSLNKMPWLRIGFAAADNPPSLCMVAENHDCRVTYVVAAVAQRRSGT